MNWQISAALIFPSRAIITLSLGILFISSVLSGGPLCFSYSASSVRPVTAQTSAPPQLRPVWDHTCFVVFAGASEADPGNRLAVLLHQFGFLSLTRRQSAISSSLSRRDAVAASWFWRARWFDGQSHCYMDLKTPRKYLIILVLTFYCNHILLQAFGIWLKQQVNISKNIMFIISSIEINPCSNANEIP